MTSKGPPRSGQTSKEKELWKIKLEETKDLHLNIPRLAQRIVKTDRFGQKANTHGKYNVHKHMLLYHEATRILKGTGGA
eukprot:15331371-Ditylum_brightwellii.AAC.1